MTTKPSSSFESADSITVGTTNNISSQSLQAFQPSLDSAFVANADALCAKLLSFDDHGVQIDQQNGDILSHATNNNNNSPSPFLPRSAQQSTLDWWKTPLPKAPFQVGEVVAQIIDDGSMHFAPSIDLFHRADDEEMSNADSNRNQIASNQFQETTEQREQNTEEIIGLDLNENPRDDQQSDEEQPGKQLNQNQTSSLHNSQEVRQKDPVEVEESVIQHDEHNLEEQQEGSHSTNLPSLLSQSSNRTISAITRLESSPSNATGEIISSDHSPRSQTQILLEVDEQMPIVALDHDSPSNKENNESRQARNGKEEEEQEEDRPSQHPGVPTRSPPKGPIDKSRNTTSQSSQKSQDHSNKNASQSSSTSLSHFSSPPRRMTRRLVNSPANTKQGPLLAEGRSILESFAPLVDVGLLHVGDELTFLEETSYITRDGWLDCQFTEERYPSVSAWCFAIGRAKGISRKEVERVDLVHLVTMNDQALETFIQSYNVLIRENPDAHRKKPLNRSYTTDFSEASASSSYSSSLVSSPSCSMSLDRLPSFIESSNDSEDQPRSMGAPTSPKTPPKRALPSSSRVASVISLSESLSEETTNGNKTGSPSMPSLISQPSELLETGNNSTTPKAIVKSELGSEVGEDLPQTTGARRKLPFTPSTTTSPKKQHNLSKQLLGASPSSKFLKRSPKKKPRVSLEDNKIQPDQWITAKRHQSPSTANTLFRYQTSPSNGTSPGGDNMMDLTAQSEAQEMTTLYPSPTRSNKRDNNMVSPTRPLSTIEVEPSETIGLRRKSDSIYENLFGDLSDHDQEIVSSRKRTNSEASPHGTSQNNQKKDNDEEADSDDVLKEIFPIGSSAPLRLSGQATTQDIQTKEISLSQNSSPGRKNLTTSGTTTSSSSATEFLVPKRRSNSLPKISPSTNSPTSKLARVTAAETSNDPRSKLQKNTNNSTRTSPTIPTKTIANTTSDDPTELSEVNLPVILGTGLKSSMLEQVQILVDRLGGKMVNSFSKEVTHVVTVPLPPLGQQAEEDSSGSNVITKRTIKYASAVLSGIWIVSYAWILECFSQGKWVTEDPFEITGDTTAQGAPSLSRNSIQVKHEKKLFSGYGFYFFGPFHAPSESELIALAQVGEATVKNEEKTHQNSNNNNNKRMSLLASLPKLFQSQNNNSKVVVICDPALCTEEQAQEIFFKCGRYPIDFNWILDSVSYYEIQDQSKYRIAPSDPPFETQNSLAY